jgi:hypothetical protein
MHALYTLSYLKYNKAPAYSSKELLNLKSTPNKNHTKLNMTRIYCINNTAKIRF